MTKAIAILALFFCAISSRADDRFWIAAKVDGKLATFVFDTGSDYEYLFADDAHHLGLTDFPDSWTSEDCNLEIGSSHCLIWFGLFRRPPVAAMALIRLLGWPLFKGSILRLDAESGVITPLSSLPNEVTNWTHLSIDSHSSVLVLEIGDEKHPGKVLIDTGNPGGVGLPISDLNAWHKKSHSSSRTINSIYAFYGDAVAIEEAWADEFKIGPITLNGTPVAEAIATDYRLCPTNYVGTLGMAALKRLDLVIDGPSATAYIRSKTNAPPPYNHNRMAVGFLPGGSSRNDLVAQVLEGGPAYKAGVRTGDVLLTINGRSTRELRTDPDFITSSFKPGTKVKMTIARGSKTLTKTVVCRQLLGPAFEDVTNRLWVTNDFSKSEAPLHFTTFGPEVYFWRGLKHYKTNLFERAVADFDEAAKLQSTNELLSFIRGYCENRCGRSFAAVYDLSDYLRANSNCFQAYEERGLAYSDLNDKSNAIVDYSKCINIGAKPPYLSPVLRERGKCYMDVQDGRRALDDLRRAVVLDPTDASSYGYLSWLEATSYDSLVFSPEQAVRDARKACDLTKWDDWRYLRVLTTAYAAAGDFENAIKYEKQTLGMNALKDSDRRESENRIAAYEKHEVYTGR